MYNTRGLVVLVVATVLLASTGASGAPMPRVNVDFGASCTWYGHAPIILGVEKGWFKEVGLDVNLRTIVTSADRMLALTRGAIGWTNTGQLSVVAEMAKSNRTFYWVGMIDEVVGLEGIGARPEIRTLGDLRGRKIGVPLNSSAEVTLFLLLQDAGLTMRDVEVIPMTVTDIPTAFTRGHIDAYAIWEPTLSSALRGVPGARVLATNADTQLYRRTGAVAAGDILVMRREIVAGFPRVGQALLGVVSRAVAHIRTNPADAAAAIASCYRVEPSVAMENMRSFRYYDGSQQRAVAQRLQQVLSFLADWATSTGRITGKPDPSEWMNTRLWP
jgi:ABC-type nitrate/sulfonate/bicarbonate transport system substrate-binding protein